MFATPTRQPTWPPQQSASQFTQQPSQQAGPSTSYSQPQPYQSQPIYPALPPPPTSQALAPYGSSSQALTAPKADGQQSLGSDLLSSAASLVDEQLKGEVSSRIEAATALGVPTSSWSHAPATASATYSFPPNPRWAPFTRRRTYSVPLSLLDQFRSNAQGRLDVGLMPEIGRAWAISEHRLYLWDYGSGSEAGSVLTYDEMTDPIVCVGLVAPKKAVFVDAITHVLVICTPVLIKLVGVGLAAPAKGSASRAIVLYETERQVQTDGVSMVSVASTPGGRIFLTGADGSLRELDYTLAAGWFSSNCTLKTLHQGSQPGGPASWFGKKTGGPPAFSTLLAVDPSRKLVWTCTAGQNLSTYSYGEDSDQSVGRMNLQARLINAAQEASGVWARKWQHSSPPPNDALGIIAFNVVPEAEAGSAYGLIATTLCGARLYLALPYMHNSGLRLVHVRAPPLPAQTGPNGQRLFTPGFQMPVLQRVTAAHAFGNSGLIAADSEGKVFVATLNPGPTRTAIAQKTGQTALDEIADWTHVDAIVHAMAPMPSSTRDGQETMLLTPQAAVVLAKTRPVDVLSAVLASVGADSAEANAFVQSCGDLEASALALAIASSPDSSSELSTQGKRLYYSCTDRARRRYPGLALFLGRLLQPVWELAVCLQTPPAPGSLPGTKPSLASLAPETTLTSVHRDLAGLKAFLDAEPQLWAPPPPQWNARPDFAELAAEQHRMGALKSLVTQAVEVISFVLLLVVDISLSEVAAACDPSLLERFSRLTYRELMAGEEGRKVANELVTVVINQQISRGQSVDVISNTLEQRCGSICSKDDILLYKVRWAVNHIRLSPQANELFGKAKEAQSHQQQTHFLRESLQLFNKAAARISEERLKSIVEGYRSIAYLNGAIELALHCAMAWDPQQLGPSWRADGSSDADPRKTFDARRQVCYEAVLDVLSTADRILDETTDGQGSRSLSEADGLRTSAYNAALASNDAAFHTRLYDWFIEKGRTDQLLSIRSAFLESYLRTTPSNVTDPNRLLERQDLLWQYYVRNQEYANAAGVLVNLASSTELPIGVFKRLEYLSLASSNIRSQFPSAANRHDMIEFLASTDERLEVAQVQVEVHRAISQSSTLTEDRKSALLDELDRQLYTISDLYNKFAGPLDMPEVTLLIFHVSDHRDPDRVAELWTRILDHAQPGKPTTNMASKIVELGQRFYPSESVFPIDDLVSELEVYSLENGQQAEPGWVIAAMHEAGVPFDVLYGIYESLFESRSPPWHTSKALSHIAASALLLVETWVEQAARASSLGYHHTDSPGRANGVQRLDELPVVDLTRQLDRFQANLPSEVSRLRTVKQRLLELR